MNELIENLGFVWFKGVVEDRNDPMKLGRCRVRCLGFHSEDKQKIPTKDLPWAFPIQPITSAAISGVGSSPTGPVEGTWIFGFFMDGESCQQPVMLGTLGGIPQEGSNPLVGFNDPAGVYPKAGFTGEADTSRIARNENIDKTVIGSKLNDINIMELSTGVDEPDKLTELSTPYNAVYPFNHVTETESGHVFEMDDTPESERIHLYHKAGTFVEIHPDGTMVRKIKGDNYEILENNGNLHIKGNCNITVEGDSNIYAKSNVNMKTDGDFNHLVTNGNYTLNVKNKITMVAGEGKSVVEMSSEKMKLEQDGSIYLN